jgi:hypothetical protein
MGVIVLARKERSWEQLVIHQAIPMVSLCALRRIPVLLCAHLVSHVCAPRYSVMLQSSLFDCLTSY